MIRRLLTRLKRRAIYHRCLTAPSRTIVLRYHAIGTPEEVSGYADPGLALPADRFREHVRILAKRFRIVSMDAVVERLEKREAGPPLAAITFDDGYRDNHDRATEILEAEGATATFYVTSRPLEPGRWFWISELRRLVERLPSGRLEARGLGAVDVPATGADRFELRRELTRRSSALLEREREAAFDDLAAAAGVPRGEGLEGTFLTPEVARSMLQRGMVIGSHTRSHPHLDRLAADGIADEIVGGKRDLERALGAEVRHFAYPNPGGGQRNAEVVRRALRSAGFRTAVTSRPDPMAWGTPLDALPRLGVYSGEQERQLFRILGGS